MCCTLCWLHGVRYAQNIGIWRHIYVPWEQEESQRKGKHTHGVMIVAVATGEQRPKRIQSSIYKLEIFSFVPLAVVRQLSFRSLSSSDDSGGENVY